MGEPIRVLHVIGIMNRGGAETMIMNLYRHIDRSKVQFDFVENSFEPAAYDDEIKELGGRIYRCPHFNGKNLFQYKKWWKQFFKEHTGEYKIVHGHIGSSAAIYLWEAKRNGLYTIAHSHSIGQKKITTETLLYGIVSYPTRFIADFFFACSRNAGISRYGKKVGEDENRCVVLKNAIDVKAYAFSEEIRKKQRLLLGIDQCLVIGNVGRFEPVKNHFFMLDVFAECLKNGQNIKLMLVGDGYLRTAIEKRIDDLRIRDDVLLLGLRDDVPQLLQAMDVFLLPSLYEGVPLCLIEAQTAGLPCLVSTEVSKESDIDPQLIHRMRLDQPISEWAKMIGVLSNSERKAGDRMISKNGYDIDVTSHWLCDYYISTTNKQETGLL